MDYWQNFLVGSLNEDVDAAMDFDEGKTSEGKTIPAYL